MHNQEYIKSKVMTVDGGGTGGGCRRIEDRGGTEAGEENNEKWGKIHNTAFISLHDRNCTEASWNH